MDVPADLTIEGYLSCVQFLVIMNKAVMNICVQVFVRRELLVSLG